MKSPHVHMKVSKNRCTPKSSSISGYGIFPFTKMTQLLGYPHDELETSSCSRHLEHDYHFDGSGSWANSWGSNDCDPKT